MVVVFLVAPFRAGWLLAQVVGVRVPDFRSAPDRCDVAVDTHDSQIISLRLWQAGMMAVIICVSFVIAPLLTILGPAIRIKFGLP